MALGLVKKLPVHRCQLQFISRGQSTTLVLKNTNRGTHAAIRLYTAASSLVRHLLMARMRSLPNLFRQKLYLTSRVEDVNLISAKLVLTIIKEKISFIIILLDHLKRSINIELINRVCYSRIFDHRYRQSDDMGRHL